MTAPDNRPTVAPVEGWYAEQRSGRIVLYTEDYHERHVTWDADGKARYLLIPEFSADYDFVATFAPEHFKAMKDNPDLMAAVADGRVGDLIEACASFVQYWHAPANPSIKNQVKGMHAVDAVTRALAAIKGETT